MGAPLVALAVAASIGGCTGRDTVGDFTEDIRIDAAAASNDPDSTGTKMCVTSQASSAVIYVLFLDNRNQPEEDRNDIWLQRSLDLGKTWLPAPVKVNQGDESNVEAPDLYCNELGVFVVWEDDRDGELENHQIYFNASYDQGETFLEEDILIEDDPEGATMSLGPRIEGFGSSLFVVWYDNTNGAYDILVNVSSNGGGEWDPRPARIDSDIQGSAYSALPDIAVGNNGNDVWVVWEDSRDGSADIYFNHSSNGGTSFEQDVRLDRGDAEGANDSFQPQICASGDNVYVVWHDTRNGDNSDIYMNYSADGGENWLGAAQRMEGDAPGAGNSLFPKCVAEGSTLHATWYDQRSDQLGTDIYYRKAVSGLTNEPEVRLDVGIPEEGYANSRNPQIAIDGGTVVVGWQDARGEVPLGTENGYEDLYYNYAQPGTSFSSEEDFRIDSMYDGRSFKVDLNIAVLGGSWYAAWTDGRDGTSNIYFQSFPLGEQARPPRSEDLEQPGG